MPKLLNSQLDTQSEGTSVTLIGFYVNDIRPKVGEPIYMSWQLELSGGDRFAYLEELKVRFGCDVSAEFYEIIDIAPFRVDQPAVQWMLKPFQIQIGRPCTDEKVNGSFSRSEATWRFSELSLLEHETEVVEAAIALTFTEQAAYHPIRPYVEVEPIFYGRHRVLQEKNYPLSQPVLEKELVLSNIDSVIAYDPKLGLGRPDLEEPLEKRIIEYTWELATGIMRKGEIRNVSLRARTHALTFDELRKGLPADQHNTIMKAAGRCVGADFVVDFEKHIHPVSVLKELADYDSSAGMGRFEYKVDSDSGLVYEIEVDNSFVAYGCESEEPVCDWLSGYFEGILYSIVKKSCTVVEKRCIAQGHPSCVFCVAWSDE